MESSRFVVESCWSVSTAVALCVVVALGVGTNALPLVQQALQLRHAEVPSASMPHTAVTPVSLQEGCPGCYHQGGQQAAGGA